MAKNDDDKKKESLKIDEIDVLKKHDEKHKEELTEEEKARQLLEKGDGAEQTKKIKGIKISYEDEEEGEETLAPLHHLLLPGDIAEYTRNLQGMKPEDLRTLHTKEHYEKMALMEWTENLIKALALAKKTGEDVVIPQMPGTRQQGSRDTQKEEEDDELTRQMKKIAGTMMPWKMMQGMFEEGGRGSGNKGEPMFRYKTEDGEIEMPMSQVPMWMNPMFGGSMMGGRGEKNSSDKSGDVIEFKDENGNDIKMPIAFYPMYMMQQQQRGVKQDKDATVKIRDIDGKEQEIPAGAAGAFLDMQRMYDHRQPENKSSSVEMVTITDDDGHVTTMPATLYPIYLANQQTKQQQQRSVESQNQGQQRGGGGGGDALDAQMIANIRALTDTVVGLQREMAPERMGKNAAAGLLHQVEEWNAIKGLIGGGGESDAVATARIAQAAETERKRIEENAKIQREEHRTKQSEYEASKFQLMLGGGGAQQQRHQVVDEEEQRELLARHDGETIGSIFDKSEKTNAAFLKKLKEESEKEDEE